MRPPPRPAADPPALAPPHHLLAADVKGLAGEPHHVIPAQPGFDAVPFDEAATVLFEPPAAIAPPGKTPGSYGVGKTVTWQR